MDTETSKLSSGNTAFEFGASKAGSSPKGRDQLLLHKAFAFTALEAKMGIGVVKSSKISLTN